MKKIILSAGFLLFTSGIALAMPKVGDDAVYDVTDTQNGQTLFQGTVELQLVSFNTPTLEFLERTISTDANGPKIKDEMVDGQFLLSSPQVSGVLRLCESHYNGKRETITVPAGTFDCCAIPAVTDSENGATWISNVAFTIVKMELQMTNGRHIVKVLRSQHMAQ